MSNTAPAPLSASAQEGAPAAQDLRESYWEELRFTNIVSMLKANLFSRLLMRCRETMWQTPFGAKHSIELVGDMTHSYEKLSMCMDARHKTDAGIQIYGYRLEDGGQEIDMQLFNLRADPRQQYHHDASIASFLSNRACQHLIGAYDLIDQHEVMKAAPQEAAVGSYLKQIQQVSEIPDTLRSYEIQFTDSSFARITVEQAEGKKLCRGAWLYCDSTGNVTPVPKSEVH